MQAGQLRDRITIQRRTLSQDAYGSPSESWAAWQSNLPAEVRRLRSQERMGSEAGQITTTTTHRVRIRYLSGLLQTDRIVSGSDTLQIDNIGEPPNNRRRELIIECRQVA